MKNVEVASPKELSNTQNIGCGKFLFYQNGRKNKRPSY